MTRIVFPGDTNHHKTLFGEQALKWMDELAYIVAFKNFQRDFVTVKISNIKFLKPVKQNEIFELTATIKNVGKVKLDIELQGFIVSNNLRDLAIEGTFILAPVDEKMRPARL